jgi:hypothetical protein
LFTHDRVNFSAFGIVLPLYFPHIMGCGASAAGGQAGAGRAMKSVSSGDIDKAIATGRSGLVKNQRKAVSLLLGMVVINSVIRERIASEVASQHFAILAACAFTIFAGRYLPACRHAQEQGKGCAAQRC